VKLLSVIAGAGFSIAVTATTASASIVYPNIGTENPTISRFTAASTGDLIAYFSGSSAGLDQRLGLLVNGISTGITGLDNQTTTVGQSLNLGRVTMGDTLTFVDNLTGGPAWYSAPALNSDSANHVYSTTAAAGQAFAGSPAGTFVGFEDLASSRADFDYNDHTFVFNVAAVPEPSTWALMVVGFFGVGCLGYRRRSRSTFRFA
jgi:hypothetical protein